jgi:polysaccharide biosynthesis/export protein
MSTQIINRIKSIVSQSTAFLMAFASCVMSLSNAIHAQQVVDNPYLATAPASHQRVVSSSVGCTDCGSTACNSCGNGCPDPYSPAVQVPPFQQPVPLQGCYCESCIRGIDCSWSGGIEQRWRDAQPINFEPLRHGEWIGPVRIPSMLQYRIRPGDELQFVFVTMPTETKESYRLLVGDEIAIRSVVDAELKLGDTIKGIQIQPDGKIHPHLIPAVKAAGLTVDELRKVLEKEYSKLLKNPAIDVLPVRTNSKVEELKKAISSFQANGGQNVAAIVNADGQVQLPPIGNIRVVGMTLDEIKREINLRYRNLEYWGLDVEPRLIKQAPHFIFVTGEVNKPGRYELNGPTTVTQALALAEGTKVGGNLRQIVIFRRAEDWRLIATMVDLRAEHLGKRPNPADEIWIRDSDLIIVPPQPIKVFDNWVKLVFTDGIYGVAPAVLFSDNQ